MLRSRKGKPYPWRGVGTNRRYLGHSWGRKVIYLHQAVWLYHHGVVPSMLDHRNGDTKDCRIENLRVCTPAQNQYNSKKKSNNKSGFKGVVYREGYRHPWQARIVVNKAPIVVGRFGTPEEAHLAYLAAAQHVAGAFARGE